MPCRYEEPYGCSHDSTAIAKQREELDLATRLLCSLTAKIPNKYIDSDPELREWVLRHEKMDAERKRAEEAKHRAEVERLEREAERAEENARKLKEQLREARKKSTK